MTTRRVKLELSGKLLLLARGRTTRLGSNFASINAEWGSKAISSP
jgi:hypothetical protein